MMKENLLKKRIEKDDGYFREEYARTELIFIIM